MTSLYAKIAIGCALGLLLVCGQGLAQQGGNAGSSSGSPTGIDPISTGRNNMSQEDFNKLGDYVEQAKRLTKQDKEKGKTLEDLLAEDKAKAVELAKALPVTCEVTDAVLAAEGKAVVDGKETNTHTYEVACTNGMGYFLIQPDEGKPFGFSCFAAEATRKADVAAGREPGATCHLGANLDILNMATTALSRTGVACSVSKFNWLGQSAKSQIEYNEFACADGKGYILVSALPGKSMVPQSLSCQEGAKRGLICKLTEVGPIVTKQTFIDALKAHNIACTASVDRLHVIGQEGAKKRYVVEFACPEHPEGLVAFIPLTGSTAPFETKTCAEAAKLKAACILTK